MVQISEKRKAELAFEGKETIRHFYRSALTTAVLGGIGILAAGILIRKASGYTPPLQCGANCINNSECPANCPCQFGICVSQSGACTSNTDCGFPSSGQKCVNGACVSCGSMSCFCGTECYPTTAECCECTPLTPTAILAPLTMQEFPTWASEYGCLSGSFQWEGISEVGTCPSSFPASGLSAVFTYPITVSLVDSLNRPICNEEINFGLDTGSIPWSSSDGIWVGTLTFVLSQDYGITDGNGNLETDLFVTLSVDKSQTLTNISVCNGDPLGCCGIFGGNPSFSGKQVLTLTSTLANNSLIRAFTTITLDLLNCCFYNRLG